MHIQILLSLLSAVVAQDSYGSGGSYFGVGSFGLGNGYISQSPGYVGGGGGGADGGHGQQGPVYAAISTKRTFEIRPIMVESQPAVPSVVDVQPSEQPVQVIFRTQSSPVLVQQVHTPSGPTELTKTQSEDEPHRVLHEVLRPVIQEVREVIQPFRRVVQEIQPVQESINTVVARGEKRAYAQAVPMGYQVHGKMVANDEGGHYGMAMATDITGQMMAAAQPNSHLALAAQNSEMYLPNPRMIYRVARLAKGKRTRAKASRRA